VRHPRHCRSSGTAKEKEKGETNKYLKGLQIIFDPLQAAGTSDCEASPFMGNKCAICLIAAVSLVSQVRRESKGSTWSSCLIYITSLLEFHPEMS